MTYALITIVTEVPDDTDFGNLGTFVEFALRETSVKHGGPIRDNHFDVVASPLIMFESVGLVKADIADVQVCGQVTKVTLDPSWTIGAIATKARWQTGYGTVPFDEWEIRTDHGVLLDPAVRPGPVTRLVVERKPGVGG